MTEASQRGSTRLSKPGAAAEEQGGLERAPDVGATAFPDPVDLSYEMWPDRPSRAELDAARLMTMRLREGSPA